jgi:hypothetical protein
MERGRARPGLLRYGLRLVVVATVQACSRTRGVTSTLLGIQPVEEGDGATPGLARLVALPDASRIRRPLID